MPQHTLKIFILDVLFNLKHLSYKKFRMKEFKILVAIKDILVQFVHLERKKIMKPRKVVSLLNS